jgi:hypothetical protein
MKSAYELAMERLNKTTPTVKITDAQKRKLGELESKCQAKVAEREIALKAEIVQVAQSGDFEAVEKLEQQLVHERKAIQAEFEEKKEAVRKSAGRK